MAALPRLYHLGNLGFYMDEETTAFASKSMAEGKEPQMPSGMPYHRALPHTWLNSISARIFGIHDEYSYRLPSALFGILTVPLIFLLTKPHLGTSVAFLTALLLALSEWHIITSRLARMYAPFLFFYVACSFSILRWAQKDTFYYLATAIILFITAASFHNLGVFLAFIPMIALFVQGYATTPQYKLILFSVISGISAYLYGQIFVAGPYTEWKVAHGITSAKITTGNYILPFIHENGVLIARGVTGSALGIWLGFTSRFTDIDNGNQFRTLTRYAFSVLFGCLSIIGLLHGASLSILLLMLLYPGSIKEYLKQIYKPVVIISTLTIIFSIQTIVDLGFFLGIRSLFTFPYPNWIVLYGISSGIFILFVALMLHLAINKKSATNHDTTALVTIALFPIILIGIFVKWAPARYILVAYPFILISSAYALQTSIRYFFQLFSIKQRMPIIAISSSLALSGLLGGHGLLRAYKIGIIDYGVKLNSIVSIYPFYPDHKSPGIFVAKHRKPGDIVIAEDVLEQRWYVGKVDYWLREYGAASDGKFSFKKKDGKLHDIYTDSIVANSDALRSINNINNKRIWIITSGETHHKRDLSLNKEQHQWLENIKSNHKPVFIGKDNITSVYCLNCETVD